MVRCAGIDTAFVSSSGGCDATRTACVAPARPWVVHPFPLHFSNSASAGWSTA